MTTYSPPLSEQFAEAVRDYDFERVSELSPHAACVMPLLNALGWRTFSSEIIEALPHFANHFDLIDLRNMMVTLGYDSDEESVDLSSLSPELLPCLFVNRNHLFVLCDRDDGEFVYFDAISKEEKRGALTQKGTAFVFTDANTTHAVTKKPEGEWFGTLVNRFRGLIKHLLAMTAILNIMALVIPLFIMTVYDKVIGTKSLDALPFLAGGIVFVLAIELALRMLRAKTLGLVAGRLDYLIGVETFRQLVYMSPLLTERSSVATQLSTLKQFDSVRDFFTGPTAAMVLEAPFVILFVVVIAMLGGWLALVPLAMLVLYALFAVIWLPMMNQKVLHAGAARTARQHMLMETMSGIRELKALGAERVWRERFRETSSDTLCALYRTATSQAILECVTYSMMTLSGVIVLAMGTVGVMADELSIGALIAIMAMIWRILGPIQGLFLAYVKFDQILAGVRTINQLMKINVERTSGKSALLSPSLKGTVDFDRLSFRYSPSADPALLGVSFGIAPKDFVAVIGNNASGKSTLLKLIAGMYNAQSGSVRIDDIDTRQFNPIDIRRLVAYVPQHPTLFHGTIAQNLRFKNITATETQLIDAVKKAGIWELIETLPDGLDTRIGDRATDRLPSGLVHGICLARAFVRPTPILLLDEPGASLDFDADQLLMQQLKKLRGHHTVVMVSHRPSHIRLATKAVLLQDGVVQFVGDPQQALAIMEGQR